MCLSKTSLRKIFGPSPNFNEIESQWMEEFEEKFLLHTISSPPIILPVIQF